jgi:membrane fusion protein (multidrug efflux system)
MFSKFPIVSFCLMAVVAVSCKNDKNESSDQEELLDKREKLVLQLDSIQDLISEIDAEIQKNDTNASKTAITAYRTRTGTFEHFVEIYGTLEADKNADVTPETQGTITVIHVREGQEVKKGTLLIELDATVLSNNIREAETQLAFAKTVYDKQKRLWDQKIGSELQYLESKNAVDNLQSRLKTLRSQFEQTRIRAPFDGKVDEIFGRVGQLASPQMPLLRLVNLKKVYLNADVSERYIRQITEGSPARLEFPSLQDTVHTTVTQTGNVINPANRTFRVVFRLENSNEYFKPNLMANVYILDYKNDSVVSIPYRMVQQDPQGTNYVYVVVADPDNNAVGEIQRRVVELGKTYRSRTEILNGIEPGEMLVDKGSRSVKSGQRVRINEILETISNE